ncbi:hypothetical protein DERP_007638 [Dermatophagoides pteronyssinus]|uniref:Uncharacterized protein n=1 Tax=Dermatophagoides pteronyssinus TaxID=6956 RepID=A0ABQ8JKB9_DERPT|nr:hypothetical protein DERP_007638 [Dermatophagoides pteronyssinus]
MSHGCQSRLLFLLLNIKQLSSKISFLEHKEEMLKQIHIYIKQIHDSNTNGQKKRSNQNFLQLV